MNIEFLTKRSKFINLKLVFVFFILTISLFSLSSLIDDNKSKKLLILRSIEKTSDAAQKLISNERILEFAKKHLFKKEARNFEKFVAEATEKYFVQNLKISQEGQTATEATVKTLYRITGTFWHDSFIFEFIENLKDFSPGFLRILSLEIDKFAKISTSRPVIKTETICELYSSK